MEHSSLKQRLIGVAVLIALVVIFLPMLFEPESVTRLSDSVVPPEPEWDFRPVRPIERDADLPSLDAHPSTVSPAGRQASDVDGSVQLAGIEPEPPPLPSSQADGHSPRETVEHPPLSRLPSLAEDTRPRPEAARQTMVEPRPIPEPEPAPRPVATSVSPSHPESAPGPSVANAKRPSPTTVSATRGAWHEVTVRRGDNLYKVFGRAGMPASEVKAVLRLGQATAGLSNLRPGQRFRLRVDDQHRLQEMVYYRSRGRTFRLLRGAEGLAVAEPDQTAVPPPAKTERQARETPKAKPKPKPKPSLAKATDTAKTGGPKKASKHRAWVVQLASLGNKAKALKLRDRLRHGGYPAFLEPTYSAGNKVWRVRVGPELHKDKATALRSRLQKEFQLAGMVMPYP